MKLVSRLSMVLVAALFASLPALVSAAPLICESEGLQNPTPGMQGLSVSFEPNDKGVSVGTLKKVLQSCTDSERFEKVWETHLNCHPFNPGSQPPSPDRPQINTACSDPDVMDRGHEIYLSSAEFTGIRYAEVYERHFWGQEFIAELPCQPQTPDPAPVPVPQPNPARRQSRGK